VRPSASPMKLPFGIPDSNRLLDPTMPANSTGHFQPVAPPPGLPGVAQITNVMTNFGWEYVWHCHLLGHEENDMMRALVLDVPSTLPLAPSLSGIGSPTVVNLTWTDGTPVADPATPGNPANEVGFRTERAIGTGGAFSVLGTALANTTSYSDTTVVGGTLYRYRVVAFNAAGDSPSNILSIRAGAVPPAAPDLLGAALQPGLSVLLGWRDNATNETGFVIERSVNRGAFTQLAVVGPKRETGTVRYTDTAVTVGNTYAYRVMAVNGPVQSAYSNTATVVVSAIPAAPSNLTASAVRSGSTVRVTLRWTDNSIDETSFTIQRSTNSTFTNNLFTINNVPPNIASYTQTSVPRQRTFYYRIRALNAAGASAWSNAASVRTP